MDLKEIEAIERWYEGESYMPDVMDNFKEVIRLAKLGLWAEEHGAISLGRLMDSAQPSMLIANAEEDKKAWSAAKLAMAEWVKLT